MDEAQKRIKLMEHVTIDWNEFKDKKVLDIGPAFGGYSELAHYHGAKLVDACETDPEMIAKFINLNKEAIELGKVNIFHSDFHKWSGSGKQYDIVMFLAVLHHTPDHNKALDTVFELCEKGGIIYLECPMAAETLNNYKPFKNRNKKWCWVPSVFDLKKEIKKRGGKVVFSEFGYTYKHSRIFMKIIR